MNETIKCHQKRRPLFVPPQAAREITQYEEAGVFGPTIGGSDQFCANLTLTKRPNAHESRFHTLADKNQNKVDNKLGQEVEASSSSGLPVTCALLSVPPLTIQPSHYRPSRAPRQHYKAVI